MTVSLFFSLYCLEAGLFFLFAPWTRFWSGNPLFHLFPSLAPLLTSAWLRGFVSGFGLVHLLTGVREVWMVLRRQRAGR